MGVFTTALGVLAGVARGRARELGSFDVALLAAATFKAAHTAAHDEVTSFVREPFVQGEAHEGDETPVQSGGPRMAIGELITCTRCVGLWIAGGLTSLTVASPRAGRIVNATLAAAAANDWLQAGFSLLTAKANQLERSAG